jgi:hypothetical protein
MRFFVHSNLLAEPARHLVVSLYAISKAVKRTMKEEFNVGCPGRPTDYGEDVKRKLSKH